MLRTIERSFELPAGCPGWRSSDGKTPLTVLSEWVRGREVLGQIQPLAMARDAAERGALAGVRVPGGYYGHCYLILAPSMAACLAADGFPADTPQDMHDVLADLVDLGAMLPQQELVELPGLGAQLCYRVRSAWLLALVDHERA